MDAATFGKILVGLGVSIAIIGAGIWLLGKSGVPFGSLPGDIRIERGKTSFYLPIATCIVLSIGLTIVVNVLLRFFR